ncbi:hypothetical protein [Rhizobium phaseoli]|uniref:hypothetical protein n=1 Tax=Rhizobium phaseoli TaxID=396 RepID=UPI0011AE35DB|nr:hypothetical protein [Rhizobium phaseoli]
MDERDVTRPDQLKKNVRHAYGKIISLAQPTPEELRFIIEMCGANHRVYRVDVACDFHTSTAQEAAACAEYLRRHGWQKWRGRARTINNTENVAYWSANAKTTRNIALYSDKPSRKTNEPCAHWEMRFITAAACQRAELNDLGKLLEGVDALRLLNRQFQLRLLDRNRFFKLTEEVGRRTKRRARRAFEATPVDQLQRRVHGLVFAALQTKDFTPDETTIHTMTVQEIHDRAPRFIRNALVEVRKWEEFTTPPGWWLR